MTELQLLQAVRRRLAVPERWCPKGWGTSERGCLVTALNEEGMPTEWYAAKILPRVERLVGTTPMIFNDQPSTTHADVVALLDRAIQECLAEQAESAGQRSGDTRSGYKRSSKDDGEIAELVNCGPAQSSLAAEPVEVA